MAKASSRKHATHRKARAQHSTKTHARRPSGSRSSPAGVINTVEVKPEAEIIDDESTIRPESRVSDEELDDEAGIYGAGRGETAGDKGEATS